MNKPLFEEIKRKITYKALNLLLREWISAGKLVKEITASHMKPPPNIEHDTYKKKCALSIQYGLLCKCFLYHCLVKNKVILSILIHLYWFIDGPFYVTKDG